jgi:hypothetical protein
LATYTTKLNKMRDGPGKQAIKAKALKVLQRRKMYESQRDQLQQQSFNMEQANMMQDNLKNVMTTVDAMKTTNKSLKQQYGKINIDKIEKMQDEMADLMAASLWAFCKKRCRPHLLMRRLSPSRKPLVASDNDFQHQIIVLGLTQRQDSNT